MLSTILSKTPYKQRTPYHEFLPAKLKTPPNPSRHQFRVLFTNWSHWTNPGARGGREEDVGLLLEARASPENDLTIANHRPSHLPVDCFLWPISATVSEQIGYLPSSRSHRSSRYHEWCPIARRRAAQAIGHGGFPATSVSPEPKEGEALHSYSFRDGWRKLDRAIPLRG
jgi:hypothetical protein